MLSPLDPGGVRRATIGRGTYLVVQGGTSVAGFAVLARLLDPAQLGAAALALAIVVSAQVLGDLGLAQLTTVEGPQALAQGVDEHRRLERAVGELFCAGALVAALAVVVTSLFVPAAARPATLAAAPAAAAAVVTSGAESLRRASGDVWTPVRLAVLSRGPFFLALPLVAWRPEAMWAMIVFSACSVLGSLPAAMIIRRALSGPRADEVRRRLMRGAVANGFVGICIAAATRGNVVMLASAGGLLAVAQFEAAWRGFQPGVYVAGALGTAATPYVAVAEPSAAAAITRRGVRACAGFGLAGGAALALLAPLVARLLYAASDPVVIDCLRILAAVLPVTLVGFYVQTAVLLPHRAFGSLIGAGVTLVVVTLGLTAWFGQDARGCASALAIGQVAYLAAIGAGVLRLRSAAAA